MSEKVTYGDLGTIMRATITESGSALDVSAATAKQIIFTKPSGTRITRTATFTTDGTDGKIEYQTVANDIDERGIWKYRGVITFSATEVFSTVEFESFEVIK